MDGAGNWLALLKWSLAQTSDGTVPTEATPMSEEDKKWLEQVMRECVKDEPKRMNEIMGIFVKMLEEGLTEDKSEEIIELLDELQFMVEQVDMAGVFAKFGGFQCLLGLVEGEAITAEARGMAASTLASLTQNNLEVQDIVFTSGMLDRLAKVYLKSESVLVCNKVLYAISCSIRNHAAAEEYFVLHFAEATLPKAISAAAKADASTASGAEALTSRALFLSNALVMSDHTNPARVEKLSALLLPACLEYLNHDSINLRETTENLLTTLQKHNVEVPPAPLMLL